jgi:glycosyltransferase involved in cell wall biosynthesis
MKVSVVLVTFNHEAFVDAALRSAFEQRARFDFEIIVSEDASTDRTLEIVERWRAAHPDRVRVIASERNLRTNEVVARGFRAARGDYVALLDGDDLWTSPDKLQLQAEFLDAHPDVSVCFHDAAVVDERGEHVRACYTPARQKERSTLDDLWAGNPFATCTSMFRRAALPIIPAWYAGFFPITDWPLYVLFAERGAVGYFPAVLAAYRVHAGGLYSRHSAGEKLVAVDAFYRRIDACLEHRYHARVRAAHRRYFYDWARRHAAHGERDLARLSFRLGRSLASPWAPAAAAETAALWLTVYGPRRHREPAPGERT